MEWKTIDSAPKDGTIILGYQKGQMPEIVAMKFFGDINYAAWIYVDEVLSDLDPDCQQPSHWAEYTPPQAQEE